MTAPTRESPIWNREELGHGNFVLLAFVGHELHLLVPPGGRIGPDEHDEDRGGWRYAVWAQDPDLGPPLISIDSPDRVATLASSEVVDLLPAELHDFVRHELARQLCRAATFSKPPRGGRPIDHHAQLAGRTCAWVSAELSDAFPGERWFEPIEPLVRIPRTVDELLERMPPAERRKGQADRRTRLEQAGELVGSLRIRAEYGAFVGLASALRWIGRGREGGASERLSQKLDRLALGGRYRLVGEQSELTR
jgi:hypothetical protein